MESVSCERTPLLVTGSSGFLGEAVSRELARDFQVIGLDRRPPDPPIPGAVWVRCDLTSDASVREAFRAVCKEYGTRCASSIHLAIHHDLSGEDSRLHEELTVQGTSRLLAALQDLDAEQLVFGSTALVLRPSQRGELLTEDSPIEAEWEYPHAVVEAERLVREERGGIPAVVLRLAGLYDESGHAPSLAHQISRIHQKKLEGYFFPGDPRRGQAFVHLQDAVVAFRKVVEQRHQLGSEELFNIAEPDVVTYAEIQEVAGAILHGKEWPALRTSKPVAKAGAWVQGRLAGGEEALKPWMAALADAHYPMSIERARLSLNWEPRHRLRRTLPEIVKMLQEDPRAWYVKNGLEPPG
jgi:nucleoside-diphosphate-sugar epimerase